MTTLAVGDYAQLGPRTREQLEQWLGGWWF
jgi:hypothetical protein